jgi:hypothetical protein
MSCGVSLFGGSHPAVEAKAIATTPTAVAITANAFNGNGFALTLKSAMQPPCFEISS